MKKKRNILIIAGPTGCGESTITKEIIKRFPNFIRLVTATTRLPRGNEKEGIDYYFFSKKRFEDEIKKRNIIEHIYVRNRDHYYGTYKKDFEDKLSKGFNIIVNTDLIGAKFYKKKYNALTVFIKPESVASIKRRLIIRNPNISQKELDKRLVNAVHELKYEQPYYEYKVINRFGQLEKAIKRVTAIIKKEGYELG